MQVDPEEAEINEEVTVTADIENTGDELTRQDIVLKISREDFNVEMKEEGFILEADEKREVLFAEEASEEQVEPGTYDLILKSDKDSTQGEVEVLSSIQVKDPAVITEQNEKLIFTLDIKGIDLEISDDKDLMVGSFLGLHELHSKEFFENEDFEITEIENMDGGGTKDYGSYSQGYYNIYLEQETDNIKAGGYITVELDPHDENNQWEDTGSVYIEAERLDNEHTDGFEVFLE